MVVDKSESLLGLVGFFFKFTFGACSMPIYCMEFRVDVHCCWCYRCGLGIRIKMGIRNCFPRFIRGSFFIVMHKYRLMTFNRIVHGMGTISIRFRSMEMQRPRSCL